MPRPSIIRVCQWCGVALPPKSPYNRKYCGIKCKNDAATYRYRNGHDKPTPTVATTSGTNTTRGKRVGGKQRRPPRVSDGTLTAPNRKPKKKRRGPSNIEQSIAESATLTYMKWEEEDPELYQAYAARANAVIKAAEMLDNHPTNTHFNMYDKLARPLTIEWQKERQARKHQEIGKSLAQTLDERCKPIYDCGCGMWDGLADAESADSVARVM